MELLHATYNVCDIITVCWMSHCH